MNCARAKHAIQLQLDGELPPYRQAWLNAHLATCDACRRVRDQHLAVRHAIRELAGEPSGGAWVDFGRSKGVRWRAAIAAAAVVGLCIGGWLAARRVSSPPASQPKLVEHTTHAPTEAPTAPPAVEVTFDPADDVIAVPIETENPNVTIIWVYPKFETTAAEPAQPSEPPSSS